MLDVAAVERGHRLELVEGDDHRGGARRRAAPAARRLPGERATSRRADAGKETANAAPPARSARSARPAEAAEQLAQPRRADRPSCRRHQRPGVALEERHVRAEAADRHLDVRTACARAAPAPAGSATTCRIGAARSGTPSAPRRGRRPGGSSSIEAIDEGAGAARSRRRRRGSSSRYVDRRHHNADRRNRADCRSRRRRPRRGWIGRGRCGRGRGGGGAPGVTEAAGGARARLRTGTSTADSGRTTHCA